MSARQLLDDSSKHRYVCHWYETSLVWAAVFVYHVWYYYKSIWYETDKDISTAKRSAQVRVSTVLKDDRYKWMSRFIFDIIRLKTVNAQNEWQVQGKLCNPSSTCNCDVYNLQQWHLRIMISLTHKTHVSSVINVRFIPFTSSLDASKSLCSSCKVYRYNYIWWVTGMFHLLPSYSWINQYYFPNVWIHFSSWYIQSQVHFYYQV